MFINIIQNHKINIHIIYNYIIVKNIQGFIHTMMWLYNYTEPVTSLINVYSLRNNKYW